MLIGLGDGHLTDSDPEDLAGKSIDEVEETKYEPSLPEVFGAVIKFPNVSEMKDRNHASI